MSLITIITLYFVIILIIIYLPFLIRGSSKTEPIVDFGEKSEKKYNKEEKKILYTHFEKQSRFSFALASIAIIIGLLLVIILILGFFVFGNSDLEKFTNIIGIVIDLGILGHTYNLYKKASENLLKLFEQH
jgi:hypothetical protein